MSDAKQWTIQIGVALPICTWISDLGGPAALTTSNVLFIMRARLGLEDPGFEVTTPDVLGVLYYRLGLIGQGNSSTGCEFT